MREHKKAFGNLLKKGIRAIALEEERSIKAVQEQIAFELDTTVSSIEKWEQGQISDSAIDKNLVKHLAENCIQKGKRDEIWLNKFLSSAGFSPADFPFDFFPPNKEIYFYAYRSNLPPRPCTQFIGREAEFQQLIKNLSKHRMHLFGLFGPGGNGKTTLALEVGHYFVENFPKLKNEDRFKAIVFFSAKTEMFGEKGKTPFKYTYFFDNIDNLFRNFSYIFSDTLTDSPNLDREDKIKLMHQCMRQAKVLLILDNLEEVSDPDLNRFLLNIPEPSKALITSRHQNLQGVYEINLPNLSFEETVKLIEVEAKLNQLDLTKSLIEDLSLLTKGVPLLVNVSVRRMRHTSPEEELTKLSNPNNELLDFIFEPSLRLVRGSLAYNIFLSLVFFPSGATTYALNEIVNLTGNYSSTEQALAELEVLSLINRTQFSSEKQTRYFLGDLAINIAKSELNLTGSFDLKQKIRKDFINYFEHLLLQVRDQQSYKALEGEIENILESLMLLLQEEDFTRLSKFFEISHDILNAYGYWEIRHRLVTEILQHYAEKRIWEPVARLFTVYITSLNSWEQQLEKSGQWIAQGKYWAETSNLPALKAQVHFANCKTIHTKLKYDLKLKAQPSERKNLIDEALNDANISIKIFTNESQQWKVFLMAVINETAGMLRDEKQYEKAMEYYNLARESLHLFREDKFNTAKWKAVLIIEIAILKARESLEDDALDFQQHIDTIKKEIQNLVHRKDLAQTHMSVAYYQYLMGNEAYVLNYKKGLELIDKYKFQSPITLEQTFLEDSVD